MFFRVVVLITAQNLPDDRRLQRSHTYHRGLMGQNSVEDLGAETWVKLEIPMVFSIFLGLLFKTIVRWFSFIQLVSLFYGYVVYIKWLSKSVVFLGDIF